MGNCLTNVLLSVSFLIFSRFQELRCYHTHRRGCGWQSERPTRESQWSNIMVMRTLQRRKHVTLHAKGGKDRHINSHNQGLCSLTLNYSYYSGLFSKFSFLQVTWGLFSSTFAYNDVVRKPGNYLSKTSSDLSSVKNSSKINKVVKKVEKSAS